MRITKGKVVNGNIVVEGEPERTFTLSRKEEAILLESIAEAERGKLIDAKEILKRLP